MIKKNHAISLVLMLAFLVLLTKPQTTIAGGRSLPRSSDTLPVAEMHNNTAEAIATKDNICVTAWQPCGPLYPCCGYCTCIFVWTGPYFTCQPPPNNGGNC